MKPALLEKASIFLLKQGYTIKNLTRTCFDLLARKNENILLIKVLEDANSVTREYSDDMGAVATYINASPLIIAEKAGGMLEDNVVYTRFDMYTLNLSTFINCINTKYPFIKRTQAGLTASVIGKKLKQKREELGYSLASLSKKIGVTRRMIVKYENENSEVTINRAMKIYDILGKNVFRHIDVFAQHENSTIKAGSDVSKKYLQLGFEAAETRKTPFDIISRKDKEIILTKVSDKVNPQMQSLSKLLEADNLVIFKKKKPKNIPSMTRNEFMDFEKADELVRFLKEY